MKLVFVSGRYSAPDQAGILANAKVCSDLAVEVAAAGAMPIVPNLFTDPKFMQVQDYAFWIEATRAALIRCDAIIFIHNFRDSSGARGEEAFAREKGIHRFYNIAALTAWLNFSKG